MEKRKKGSGSKENVGRHALSYKTIRINKTVPEAVYKTCLSLIEDEILKFKNK